MLVWVPRSWMNPTAAVVKYTNASSPTYPKTKQNGYSLRRGGGPKPLERAGKLQPRRPIKSPP
eukprot:COSAG01_NODE_494_length_16322_cov_35.380879_9_plen_63_part_00